MSSYIMQVVLATSDYVSNEALDEFADAMEKTAEAASVSRWRPSDNHGVVVTGDMPDDANFAAVSSFVDEAARLLRDATGGRVDTTVVDLRVCTEEVYEAEALRADIPELASAADAAEILDVTRQRVHQLLKGNARFPAPIARVASGPLWTRAAIEWFNSTWERKSGRPPASTKDSPSKVSNVRTFSKKMAAGNVRAKTRNPVPKVANSTATAARLRKSP